METFEFLVTSTVQATLYEHVKIQAADYKDAIGRIEDGEIVDSRMEIDNYLETDDISDWEDVVCNPFKEAKQLWTSEYY